MKYSEEIRGEILFVLYKISILQYSYKDDDAPDVLYSFCPKLLYLSLEALTKTQSDDVRLNCLGLSTSSDFFLHLFCITLSASILSWSGSMTWLS